MTSTATPTGTVLPQWLSTSSLQSIGSDMIFRSSSAAGGTAWPAANRAYFVPFYLSAPYTAARLFISNGGTAAGNIDVGIYRADATASVSLIVSSGSTAQAGTTTNQYFNITDTVLAPGLYYWGVAKNDTTGAVRAWPSFNITTMQASGVASMETAFPLPATATLALLASSFVPQVGMSSRAGL